MELTKEFVNSCRKVGVLRDFLCQAIDQVDEKDKEIAELKDKLRHYQMMVALLENDKKEIEERNAIHQKSLARLHELARKTYPDQEEDHREADGILCDMLNALGYKDLTDAWDKIGKWYS